MSPRGEGVLEPELGGLRRSSVPGGKGEQQVQQKQLEQGSQTDR